jgi:ABC-2 type transport system permease protein
VSTAALRSGQAASGTGTLFLRVVRAEILKLRTTRTWWGLLIGMVVPMVLLSVAVGFVRDTAFGDTDRIYFLLQQISFAKYFVLILGILAFTTEFRHNTASSTFLIAVNRTTVMVAKLVTGFLTGLVYAAVALALSLAVGLTAAAIASHPTSFSGKAAETALRIVLVQGLYGVLGVAIGSVLRNQVVAVVVTLVYFVMIEGVIRGLLIVTDHPRFATVLVGSAEASMVARLRVEENAERLGILPAWGGALVFLAYIALFAGIGLYSLRRRDIS